MKKVLVVAYYFPPVATSGAMRPLGFCRYLEKYGWKTRVLTTDPASVHPCMDLDYSFLDRVSAIQIDRVAHKTPERSLLRVRKRVHELRSKLFQQSQSSIKEHTGGSRLAVAARYQRLTKRFLEWLFSFPDAQCFWLQPAVQRLSNIPRCEYPDVIFATASPWTNLLVGEALAKKFQVPFVADFRDPLVHNPGCGTPVSFAKAAKKLEAKMCRTAARVISTTPELRKQFVIDYPEIKQRFVTITNGFDGFEYNSLIQEVERQPAGAFKKPVLEINHFGTIYGNRDPSNLFCALRELLQEGKIRRQQIRLRFVGIWELGGSLMSSCLIEQLEEIGVLSRESPIAHSECLKQMSQSDVLLLLQPGFPLQIPAKIYEYIAVRRPVLLIGGEGATANLLKEHALGTSCSNDVQQIKDLLLKILDGSVSIERPDTTVRELFDYRILTRQLASLLDEVCAG